MFLKVSQTLQEGTCVGESLSKKMQAWNFIKKDSKTGVFLWSLRNFKNIFFHRTVPVAVSAVPVAASVFFLKKVLLKSSFATLLWRTNNFFFSTNLLMFFFCLGFLSRRFTNHRGRGRAGEGEGHFLTPHYHFRPLHGHLDISRAITAESSPVHIASSRALTGNLCFPSASS